MAIKKRLTKSTTPPKRGTRNDSLNRISDMRLGEKYGVGKTRKGTITTGRSKNPSHPYGSKD